MKMRKLLIWGSVVIITMAIGDMLFGLMFEYYMKHHRLQGDYSMPEYVLHDLDEDIVVLGSSVALNSINTKALSDSLSTDSLQISAYNAGANGQAFPFYLTMLKAIVSKKKPKTIILGFIPSNLSDEGLGERYNFLAPYYGRKIADIDTNMNGGDKLHSFMLHSNFYRLNKIWFRIFLYHFISVGIQGENGFVAKPQPPVATVCCDDLDVVISDERRRELKEFLQICSDNDIDLKVVLTPRCVDASAQHSKVAQEIRTLCSGYGVEVYDDTHLEPFNRDNALFYDTNHINITGSEIYTDSIFKRLK